MFIQAAQGIMCDTERLRTLIEPFIEDCTDKRLVAQLRTTALRMTTISQQLKIIAAVKASSSNDGDKDVQLVTTCQNLMSTIKQALRDSVVCSLRGRDGSLVHLNAVNFRKVVFARQLVAAGIKAD